MVARAGDLNRVVRLQARATSQDAYGQQSAAWSDVAVVYASIRELTARELAAAGATRAAVTHEIVFRYRAALSDPKALAAMRVVMDKDGTTRVWNIHGAGDDGERRRYTVLQAEEGLNLG